MRLRYTFRFKQVGQTWLATAVGQNAHLFNGVLQLNEVGHFIVSELQAHLAIPDDNLQLSNSELIVQLALSLTNEYAVDFSTAQTSVKQVLDYLHSEQVLDYAE